MMTSLTLTILPSRVKKSVFEGFTPPPATETAAPVAPVDAAAVPAAEDAKAPATTEKK
jgi:hypothetical protein